MYGLMIRRNQGQKLDRTARTNAEPAPMKNPIRVS